MDGTGIFNWKIIGRKGEIRTNEKIGEGAKSNVYRGVFQQKYVAVKSMLFDGNATEVEILRNLDHKNIIRIHFTYFEKRGQLKINLSEIEVLKQITEGLDYLHNGQTLCTVHRDLKPSNILFQFVEHDLIWVVKISDFGISKEFYRGKTSTHTDLKGTSGYIAPELIDRADGSPGPGKVRKEVDIFSLGVIFYYMLSNGSHPYSKDMTNVNANVRDCDPDLSGLLDEYKNTAMTLILSMLEKEYSLRINVSDVKSHHLFWNDDKKIDFIQKVSDFLEDREKHKDLLKELEKYNSEIFEGKWNDIISDGNPEVERVLKKRGQKKGDSLQDLLRQIRNWIHHYHDKYTTPDLKNEIGEYPTEFLRFFTSRFPKLIPCLYDFMQRLKKEKVLHKYYHPERQESLVYETVEEQMETIRGHPQLDNQAIALASSSRPESMDLNDSSDVLGGALDSSDEEDARVSSDSFTGVAGPELVLRPYQKELAEQALKGHNSLIIAPTGSGKTAVANEIIKHHLQQRGSKSIIFLVSKTTLARQQYEFFTKYLSKYLKETEIAYLIGEITTKIAVGAIINRMRLTVLTPQILINEMKREKSFISFNDISMMIFDECHNATKKHPYKVIMDMLLDFKHSNPNSGSIQVVGMTASPGVGKGKTREEVMNNLITLLANLNVTLNPAQVERNLEDLMKYQNKTKQNFVRVEITPDRFTRKIKEAMAFLENEMKKKDVFGKLAVQFQPPPEEKDQQKYENWVMELIRHAQLKFTDQSLSRIVVLYAHHLKMYYNLLYLKRMIPNALEAVKQHAEFHQEGIEGRIVRALSEKLAKASKKSDIPMLEKLFEVLQEEFIDNGKKKDCRCIIFVPRRMISTALVDAISQNPKLAHLQPKSLTGSNEHAELGGMTKSEQSSALGSFRDGKCKILIATSVAEEGLDIRECNLVIMYNYVTGEVGRIQRAGRGRAENSRSILLTASGSDQIEREKMNEICAIATEYAINDLKLLPDQDRINKILEIQKKQSKERLNDIAKDWKKLQEAKKWDILCGQCKKFITNASNIRHINNQHRFVVDPDFLTIVKRIPCQPHPLAPGVPFEQTAIFYCGESSCKHHLGIEMQYKNKTYPTLSVKNLIFQDDKGNFITAKQWIKCPFGVEKAIDDDDDDVEIDEEAINEFVASQVSSVSKGFITENFSEDEAKEAFDIANTVLESLSRMN